jgi:hypothetical protein
VLLTLCGDLWHFAQSAAKSCAAVLPSSKFPCAAADPALHSATKPIANHTLRADIMTAPDLLSVLASPGIRVAVQHGFSVTQDWH